MYVCALILHAHLYTFVGKHCEGARAGCIHNYVVQCFCFDLICDDKRLTTTISQSSDLEQYAQNGATCTCKTQKQPVPSGTATDIQNARLESAHE